MITLPTKFEQHHQRAGGTQAVIVRLSEHWLKEHWISDRDMNFASGGIAGPMHVHAELQSISGINQKVDPFTKKWATSNVTMTMLNPRSSPETISGTSGGTRDRVSEGFDLQTGAGVGDWQYVDIYLIAGENVTVIATDGILVFAGRVIGTPMTTEKNIIIKAQSIENEKHRILPTGFVGDTYSSAPADNLEKQIPIVYGEFNQNYWGDQVYTDGSFTGLGLAKAWQVDINEEPKYVVSDHILNAITRVFLKLDNPIVMESWIETLATDDSGKGTAIVEKVTDSRMVLLQRYRLNDSPSSSYTDYTRVAVNPANAHDNNTATLATLYDNVEDTGTYREGLAMFGIENPSIFKQMMLQLSNGDNIPYAWLRFYDLSPQHTLDVNDDVKLRVYYKESNDYISSANLWASNSFDLESWDALSIGDRGDMTIDSSSVLADMAFGFWCRLHISGSSGLNNDILFLFTEFMLEVRLDIDSLPIIAWVECKGREYGSWITDAGRSIGSKASGDLIENPAHILESILRDELGVATANIDTASFDHAYDSATAEANRVSRINIHKEVSSAKVIRELAEQSTFAFTWTAAGKAKLIPLHSSYWSSKGVDSTIPWSHIKLGSLKISKSKIYCNEVEVQSRWHGEAGVFRDTDTTSDSGSQTSYGTWRRSAKWPSLAGSARSHVANGYVNSTNGLWSRPHLIMECETLGFTNAHLELGDCIKLDSTTVDPHLKAYTESWSGLKLCVIELQQTMTGTKIKAIELF